MPIGGFQDTDYFIAFSANANDCNDFLSSYLNTSISSFKLITNLPDRVAKHGPDSWDTIYKDWNWNLDDQTEFLVYDDKRQTVLYSTSSNRIFICIWGF